MLFDNICVYEPFWACKIRYLVNVARFDGRSLDITCPTLGRLVKEVHDLEILRMLLLQCIELVSKENVLFSNI